MLAAGITLKSFICRFYRTINVRFKQQKKKTLGQSTQEREIRFIWKLNHVVLTEQSDTERECGVVCVFFFCWLRLGLKGSILGYSHHALWALE